MNYLVKKQLDFISSNVENLDDIKLDRIRYGLEVFYFEVSKLFILLMLAVVFNKLPEFILIILLLPIRFFLGGSHCKTYWGCLLKSFIFCGSIIFTVNYIPPVPKSVQGLLLLTLTLIIIVNKEKLNTNRAILTKKNRDRQKFIAISLMLIWFFISNLFFTNSLINCTILTILFIILDYIYGGIYHEKQ